MKTERENRSQQAEVRAAGRPAKGRLSTADSALQRRIDDSVAMQRQQERIESSFGQPVQTVELEEEQELPSSEVRSNLQRKTKAGIANETGMPDRLKSGIESLSGMDMSALRVHYNSSKPAQLDAHAYAQGNEIHLASGQEKHLPHEAWHTVQQRQGRVQPTMEIGGVKVNDDARLEREADAMGEKALRQPNNDNNK